MRAYAPGYPQIHDRVINAQGQAFVIGAEEPATYCGLRDKAKCPIGNVTLINDDMTLLAVSHRNAL